MEQRIVQDTKNIGDNLRALRRQAGLKQHEVAARLQIMGLPVTREIYAQIEAGTHHIRYSVLLGLREIYHASWSEMLDPVDLEESE